MGRGYRPMTQKEWLAQYRRKARDAEWAEDVRRHEFWSKVLQNSGPKDRLGEIAKERIRAIEARYPGKFNATKE